LKNVLAGLEHADFVFCNEDETAAYAVAMKMPQKSSVADIAIHMANYKKVASKPGRVAILTQGKDPVVVATNKGDGSETKVTNYPVITTLPPD
jgi:sugar/nucleoside kinase (ribokinase family)